MRLDLAILLVEKIQGTCTYRRSSHQHDMIQVGIKHKAFVTTCVPSGLIGAPSGNASTLPYTTGKPCDMLGLGEY